MKKKNNKNSNSISELIIVCASAVFFILAATILPTYLNRSAAKIYKKGSKPKAEGPNIVKKRTTEE